MMVSGSAVGLLVAVSLCHTAAVLWRGNLCSLRNMAITRQPSGIRGRRVDVPPACFIAPRGSFLLRARIVRRRASTLPRSGVDVIHFLGRRSAVFLVSFDQNK